MSEAFAHNAMLEARKTSGLVFRGTCDDDMGASTTVLDIAQLAGFGDDFFNLYWYAQVIKNTNSIGDAPESEVRKITDYVSATGVFTCDAFTQNVELSDEVLIIHESIVALGRNDADNVFDSSAVAGNADGSSLERLEQQKIDTAAVKADTGNLEAERLKRVVTKTIRATENTTVVSDVINISDKGILTGISQSCEAFTASSSATIDIIIDGVTIYNTGLFLNFDKKGDTISQSFNHPFETSLQVRHRTVAADKGTVGTIVSNTID